MWESRIVRTFWNMRGMARTWSQGKFWLDFSFIRNTQNHSWKILLFWKHNYTNINPHKYKWMVTSFIFRNHPVLWKERNCFSPCSIRLLMMRYIAWRLICIFLMQNWTYNYSLLDCLEVPQKFVWWVVGWWLTANLVINFGLALALAKPNKI